MDTNDSKGSVPGVYTLLPNPRRLQPSPASSEADVLQYVDAASNVRLPLEGGLQAIGTLLWQVSTNDDAEISKHTLFQLGAFLEQITELNQRLAEIEIHEWQHRALRAEAKLKGMDLEGVVAIPEWQPSKADKPRTARASARG